MKGLTLVELRDYWRVFRAHWIAVLVITLAGGLIGIGWSVVQPKVYAASASGILTTGVSTDIGAATIGENYAKSRIKSYIDIAKSTSVANTVKDDLKIDVPTNELLQQISVSNPEQTATLKVTANSSTPEKARDLAASWIEGISEQVSKLENADSGSSNDDQKSIVAFRSLDSAQLPNEPIFPNNKFALAVGLLIGAVFAVGYALLRNIFDRRVHSVSEVENETGTSVVGTIPFHKGFDANNRLLQTTGGNTQGDVGKEEYAIAEALRELRTNLQFMNVDNPPRKIVITSALPGEGKSTLIANLATTIAASGQRLVVVDGDLRRPMVAKTFGLVDGVGLTDVLIGRAELPEVLQPWGASGKLFVLGAGKIPPNPSELLASQTFHDIIDDLAEHAIVLIDAPPLLPVTDAAILTARTDGALVVTRANRTTYDELKAALGNITKVSGHVLGIIINGTTNKGSRNDGYGYRYRSYYSQMHEQYDNEPVNDEFSGLLRGTAHEVPGATDKVSEVSSDSDVMSTMRRRRRTSE